MEQKLLEEGNYLKNQLTCPTRDNIQGNLVSFHNLITCQRPGLMNPTNWVVNTLIDFSVSSTDEGAPQFTEDNVTQCWNIKLLLKPPTGTVIN